MDLIWLKLTAGKRGRDVAEQTLIDILWASVRPQDKVEHISVRPGENAHELIVAIFARAGPPHAAREAALRVAHAAITTSPALAGWTVRVAEPVPPEGIGGSGL